MNKKKIIMMSTLLVVLLVVIIGITYAAYTYTGNSNLNTIDLGRISMSYTEPSNAYVLNNALPMSDDEGRGQNEYFEFTVTSHATTKESDSVGVRIPYEISISDDIEIDNGFSFLNDSYIKLNLTKVDGMTENEVVVPTLISDLPRATQDDGIMPAVTVDLRPRILYQTSDVHKNGSTTITSKYRLRAWIAEGFDVSNTEETYQYKFRVNVNSNMDALEGSATETPKLLRTAIMDQGVVNSGDGVYMSTETNDGSPTYYYRGNVENNYVNFGQKTICNYNGIEVKRIPDVGATLTEEECANVTNLCDITPFLGAYATGLSEEQCTSEGAQYIKATPAWGEVDMLWRVVRINEDRTIRLISTNFVSSMFNPNYNDYKYMYYSESNVDGGMKKALNDWYSANLTDYDSEIATSTFCEQAKVKYASDWTSGNAEMIVYTEYEPDFKCAPDGNEHGLITDQKVGLITIDELLHAGGVIDEQTQFYLSNAMTWTMSPAGFDNTYARAWLVSSSGSTYNTYVNVDFSNAVRPVISLNADTLVTGNGTSTSPWVVTK